MNKNYSKNNGYKGCLMTLLTSAVLFCSTATASELSIPNTFVANQPAVAAQVNANFSASETAINDNNSRLAALEALVLAQQATITQLQSDLSAVENNTVLELDGLLQYALIDGHDTAEFTNVNVQINSGSGDTNGIVNGKGNLIVGYNEPSSLSPDFCSIGVHLNEMDCLAESGIWGNNIHSGSHNVVIGSGHSFSSYGGFVTGYRNVISGVYTSVTGGTKNSAINSNSSISGGSSNIASGIYSTVSGGEENLTSGIGTSISGGSFNRASDNYSSIMGGENNIAFASYSTVSGGANNTASNVYSTVSGGTNNTASGVYSTVSGGVDRSAIDFYDWVAGSLFEDE